MCILCVRSPSVEQQRCMHCVRPISPSSHHSQKKYFLPGTSSPPYMHASFSRHTFVHFNSSTPSGGVRNDHSSLSLNIYPTLLVLHIRFGQHSRTVTTSSIFSYYHYSRFNNSDGGDQILLFRQDRKYKINSCDSISPPPDLTDPSYTT